MNRKAKITVIGYPRILSSCQKVAEEYLNDAHFLYYQYVPQSAKVQYLSCSPDHPLEAEARVFERVNHDISIVGIVTAKSIAGLDRNKIIPFRASQKSIIKAFLKAKKLADRAAFIAPVEEKHDVSFYENLTGLKIDIYYSSDINEYRAYCKKARQAGHSVVVSGSYTFQIARKFGLTPIFHFSDPDIFHDAYFRALETHRYYFALEEKVSQLEIISRESEDSVFFIDNSHRITFTNKVAERKLNLNADTVAGEPVSTIFDFIKPDALRNDDTEIIGKFNGEEILTAIHPVRVGQRTVGTVLMAKKIREIAAMDTRVRQQMRHKGFKARYTFKDIKGDSPVINTCRQHAELYSASDAPVLIYGATGTGKELFAQAMHNNSPRKRFPFVAINCATLPSELMESELFGYTQGAFTGARLKGKQGLVDQAHLGTLFLDEVDALPSSLQAKLLRLLQEKEFIRVGGDEVIPVDIRIIAACNRKQHDDPEKNPIRQDLFYRLCILYLELPPLAERKTDIPLLFQHFLKHCDHELAERLSPLPANVIQLLNGMAFDGNCRELQSIATRFACLCDKRKAGSATYLEELAAACCDMVTDRKKIPDLTPATGSSAFTDPEDTCDRRDTAAEGNESASSAIFSVNTDATLADAMKAAEKSILEAARTQCGGSVGKMAGKLGIARTTLWRKMSHHGIT